VPVGALSGLVHDGDTVTTIKQQPQQQQQNNNNAQNFLVANFESVLVSKGS